MTRAVVALGGNAILPKGSEGTKSEELDAIQDTINHLSTLLDQYDAVLTHGNGPQVGTLLLQQRYAETKMPLDVLVAETQAQIGYLLQQAFRNQTDRAATTLITQILVDEHDPAFEDATKPIGPYYTAEEAEEQEFPTKKVDDSDRPYRRVVPSPEPLQVIESYQIEQMLEDGTIPICCGGGGVPVVRNDGLHGVEAVIDKDHASELLARELNAELLVILTNVEHAFLNYGTDEQEPLEQVHVDEMAEYLDDGAFGEGSMRPKVEACINFIRNGGKQAIITAPEHLEAALNGKTGTRVEP